MQRARPVGLLLVLASVSASACGSGGDAQAPENQPPTVAFNSNCTGLTCTFNNFSKDADGKINAYSWDFGDGGTSTETTPAHVYASIGTFNVALTATDNDGASTTKSRTVATSQPTVTELSFTLDAAGTIKAKLTSTATCEAHGNTFRFTAPVMQVMASTPLRVTS